VKDAYSHISTSTASIPSPEKGIQYDRTTNRHPERNRAPLPVALPLHSRLCFVFRVSDASDPRRTGPCGQFPKTHQPSFQAQTRNLCSSPLPDPDATPPIIRKPQAQQPNAKHPTSPQVDALLTHKTVIQSEARNPRAQRSGSTLNQRAAPPYPQQMIIARYV